MNTTTQQFTFVRTLAIILIAMTAIFGVALVAAQEADAPVDAPAPKEEKGPADGGDENPPVVDVPPADDGGSSKGGDNGGGAGDDANAVCVPNPRVDLIDEHGHVFDGNIGDHPITIVNGRAQVAVKNRSTNCAYTVNFVSYEVFSPLGQPPHTEYIRTQKKFARQTLSIAPGATQTFMVDLPSCNYQVDLFLGSPIPETNPDFTALEAASTHTLLDWSQEFGAGLCVDDNPPPPPASTCLQNATRDLVSADGTPFNAFDGLGNEDITVVNGVASVVVKNISPDGCAYNIALTSYKTGFFDGTNRQEYIDGQEYFASEIHQGFIQQLQPGESATLSAAVPSCNYQVDLYTFVDNAVTNPEPPDFRVLEASNTHRLLDWKQRNIEGESCLIIECPLIAPVITSAQTASGVVGEPFSYTITTSGTVSAITVANLPTGLSYANGVISGRLLTAGTFTAIITASNECAATAINLVITFTGLCTIEPPVITSPQTASGTVGSAFSYTITLADKRAVNLTVANLPADLSYANNVISGTPRTAGTFIAIITASNECAATVVNLTIKIDGGSCTILPPVITSAQTASGTVGSAFSYTVTTTGVVSNITVANLPSGLSYSNGVISGTPTQSGMFTSIISASNQCAATAINLVITVGGGGGGDDDDDDDNGGGGGGSGRRRPSVVLFSNPEVLGASISLSQVPYTGLGTSLFQLALFILGLLAISGGIIYTIMRRVRTGASTYTVTSTSVNQTRTAAPVSDEPIDDSALSAYEEYAYVAPVVSTQTHVRQTVQSVETPTYTAPRTVEAPANIPTAMPVYTAPRQVAPAPTQTQQVVAPVSLAFIQTEARVSRTLISDDAAELIAKSVEGDEKKALERLNQVVEIAKSRYPREDGWLILDKDRVRESLFISTLSMIPLFVEWIVRGEDKKVFTFLRMLKQQEQPVADFMRKVVSELDTAHRARTEGADDHARVDQHIAEVTYHLSNSELESVIGELVHGVDERYDSAYTSVRLALVRVLDMIKERSLRSVGAPYTYGDSSHHEATEHAR